MTEVTMEAVTKVYDENVDLLQSSFKPPFYPYDLRMKPVSSLQRRNWPRRVCWSRQCGFL